MIEWKAEVHSVGITLMDEQHQTLVKLINALEKNKWNPDKEFQEKVINTLMEYIRDHFSTEENIMKRMNYPHLDAHIIGHKDFITKVEKFKHQFETAELSTQALSDLLNYLNNWIVKHIISQDKDYSRWLVGKE